jgi:LAO/AO transport system kinase
VAAIEAHRQYLYDSGSLAHLQEERSMRHFTDLLKERLFAEVYGHLHVNGRIREIVAALASRQTDPYSAVERVIAERFPELMKS